MLKKASKQQQRLKYTFQYDLSDASDVGGRADTCRNVWDHSYLDSSVRSTRYTLLTFVKHLTQELQ